MQNEAVTTDQDTEIPEMRPPEVLRGDLAMRLVDVLCLPSGQVSDNERAFTADILNQLFDHLSDAMKEMVSHRLSESLSPPDVLLRRMLLEPIGVAEPLLQNLSVISESMLIEAAAAGPGHRALIARRFKVTPMVADAVLAAGDVDAAIHLLRRNDIEISERRLDDLVPLTEVNAELRGPFLGRLELQPRHGFQMFWWLSQSERRRVLSRFATDRTVIQDALKNLYREVFPAPNPDPVTKNVLKLCDRRHRARGRNGETVSIDVVKKTLTNAVANPDADLCIASAFIAGVSPETAKTVLLDHGGEAFAVLAKAVGLSRQDFSAILARAMIIQEEDSRGTELTEPLCEYLLAVFDMIARDYSRTILRYWDWKRAIHTTSTAV